MGLGFTEIILIFLVVLLFFGAKRLPEVARSLGKATSEFHKKHKAKQFYPKYLGRLPATDNRQKSISLASNPPFLLRLGGVWKFYDTRQRNIC